MRLNSTTDTATATRQNATPISGVPMRTVRNVSNWRSASNSMPTTPTTLPSSWMG